MKLFAALKKVHPLVYLSFLYLLISFFLFQRYGIKNVNDSHRYLEYAANLAGGFYFEGHNFWYFGYVLFVYVVSLFSSDHLLLIIAQYVLGFFSVFALYGTSRLLFAGKSSAISACLLYLLFIDILSWNSYILAESFYTSMTCFSLYVIARFYKGASGWKFIAIGVFTLLLTFLAKPTGLVLLIAVLSVLLARVSAQIKSRSVKWTVAVGVTIGILFLANKMLATYQVIENYQMGEIIYAVTTIPDLPSLDQLVVKSMEELVIPSTESAKILQISQFVVQNPIYWFELFFKKVFYFLSHTRPFWSFSHNLVSLVFLLPSYALFVFALTKRVLPREARIFAIVFVVMHTISIGLTSVDWDGRFLIPVLPVIFLVAGWGVSFLRSPKVMNYLGWEPSS